MLDILSDYLLERRYSHERLDGTIRGDLRQAAIDRFCRPDSDTFIFLLSTRAGGLGINLTAADTCILMDSDWNPQNDVQAMARSHRIGQTKRVKVFRLVTRNTYEAEMVERANRKLGLERAMNADRAADGLPDGRGGAKPAGPTQDRAEIDAMLKRGAYNIFMEDGGDGDARFKQFSEADIDEILESSSTKVTYGGEDSGSGSVFSKAAFIADDNELARDSRRTSGVISADLGCVISDSGAAGEYGQRGVGGEWEGRGRAKAQRPPEARRSLPGRHILTGFQLGRQLPPAHAFVIATPNFLSPPPHSPGHGRPRVLDQDPARAREEGPRARRVLPQAADQAGQALWHGGGP